MAVFPSNIASCMLHGSGQRTSGDPVMELRPGRDVCGGAPSRRRLGLHVLPTQAASLHVPGHYTNDACSAAPQAADKGDSVCAGHRTAQASI